MRILAALLFASTALAQMPAEPLKTEKVVEGLWLISGNGGNVAVSIGKDGIFIVDDKVPPVAADLIAEIKKLDKRPVRFVINTHWHFDHVGGNEKIGETGAVIVAHENVRKRMESGGFLRMMKKTLPPSPPIALPVVTFADGVTLHLNGDDIEILHQPPGHTDGDSIVWFHKADVIHTGDDFVSGGYPIIDVDSGGHADGIISTARKVCKLAGASTKIIPGHGPIVDKTRYGVWADMVATIVDRVKKLAAAGKTLSEIINAKPTAEFDAEWNKGFIKPEMLLGMLWNDFKK
jgi:glyoxylase-like metal-dependent hydrolase (beta-lactamase superfamily II)